MRKTSCRLFFTIALIIVTFATLLAQKVAMVEDINAPTVSEFLNKHTTIDSVVWKDSRYLTLYLKSGSKERFDIYNEKEARSFYKKYGSPPVSPQTPNGRLSRRKLN